MNNRIARLLAAFFAFCIHFDAWSNTVKTLRIEADQRVGSRGEVILTFSVTNVSSQAIQVNNLDLPWEMSVNVRVVATTRRTHEILRPAAHLIDHRFDKKILDIAPGETLRGEMLLSQYVDQNDLMRRKGDLIVFWHFPARAISGETLGEYGGWVSVRRDADPIKSNRETKAR